MMKNYSQINRLLKSYKMILASGSPRRVMLLREAGIRFRQVIPELDETNHLSLSPYEYALSMSKQKAEAINDKIAKDEIALTSDTIVVLAGKIMGKPHSSDEATDMLSKLAGNMHTVCTAIALTDYSGTYVSGYELTDVYFKPHSKSEIREYVATGEPMDKAGAYGIQEKGVFLVDRVNGNIDNVIGLPLCLLDDLAGKFALKKGL